MYVRSIVVSHSGIGFNSTEESSEANISYTIEKKRKKKKKVVFQAEDE